MPSLLDIANEAPPKSYIDTANAIPAKRSYLDIANGIPAKQPNRSVSALANIPAQTMREPIISTIKQAFSPETMKRGADVLGITDIPAITQDIASIPSRLAGLPTLPLQSKLATEAIPRVLEKATTPVPIPSLSMQNIKSLLKGKGLTDISNDLSPVDLAFIGLGVKGSFSNAMNLARWNAYLNKGIQTEKIRGAVLNNIEPLEKALKLGGVNLPVDLSVADKASVILSQAEKSPKLGSIITGLENGTIKPLAPGVRVDVTSKIKVAPTAKAPIVEPPIVSPAPAVVTPVPATPSIAPVVPPSAVIQPPIPSKAPPQAPIPQPDIIAKAEQAPVKTVGEEGIKTPGGKVEGIGKPPIKPKPAPKASPTIDIIKAHDVIEKKKELPILNNVSSAGGYATVTDLDVSLSLKTNLEKGIYKKIGKGLNKTTEYTPEDFPIISNEGKAIGSFNKDELSKELARASRSASTKETQFILQGALLKSDGKKIQVISTDSRRLSMSNIEGTLAPGEYNIYKPDRVAKLLKALEGDITVKQRENVLIFQGDNGFVNVKLIEGEFPNVKNVSTIGVSKEVAINKEQLAKALKEITPYAKERVKAEKGAMPTITINIKKSGVTLTSKYENTTKTVNVPAKVRERGGSETLSSGQILLPMKALEGGADLGKTISMDVNLLNDAVSSVSGDDVNIYFGSGERPVIVTGRAEKPLVEKIRKQALSSEEVSASRGSLPIGKFEKSIPPATTPLAGFKLFEESKKLIKEYAQRVGERYQRKGSKGLFYPETRNIFLSALNNISTAVHEITHYVNNVKKITPALMRVSGMAKNGNPIYDRTTLPYRKALTDIYLKFYPGAKSEHSLRIRLDEGYATLIQKYIEYPSLMEKDYSKAVNVFLKPGGAYYHPIIGDFIKDAREIIYKYQQLDPNQKILSRVLSNSQNINDAHSFLTLPEKMLQEFIDNLYTLEKLAKLAGKDWTVNDPSLWARFYNSAPGFIVKNLTTDSYWTLKDDEFVKLYDFSWKTLSNKLREKGLGDTFGAWLVGRDQKFRFDEFQVLAKRLEQWQKDIKSGAMLSAQDKKDFQELADKTKALEKELKGNGFTQEEVKEAYKQHKETFIEEAKMFDALVLADLELMADGGFLNSEKYNDLINRQGYAPLKRDVYNDILGVPDEDIPINKLTAGKTKISSLVGRKGSELTIIHPIYAAIQNHAEIVKKVLKQKVYNKIYGLSGEFPDLFQKLKLTTAINKGTGQISFPQEKDPNIIMARQGGKRLPLLVSKEIKKVLDETLSYQHLSLLERIVRQSSRIFTKGTTGLYIPFTITNFVVDQFTLAAQTRNKVTPVLTPLWDLIERVVMPESQEAKFFIEYMRLGGEKQTFVRWQDMSPEEFFAVVHKEKRGIEKVIEALLNGVSTPAQVSEIASRAAEYIKARKSGKPQIVAMEEAGTVTAPFHHIGRLGGGTGGQTLLKSIPFFNPALQVLAQYSKTLYNPKTRGRALVVFGLLTSAMVLSLSYLLRKGTKKQKQALTGLQPNEQTKYIFLPHPNGEDLLRFRVPEQMGVAGGLVNMIILDRLENANFTAGEYIDGATAWIPDQLNLTNPARQLVSWLPHLLSPAMEVTLNKKFFPTVRPLESETLQRLPPGERYTEVTSKLAKTIGEKLNISPTKLDYLVQGYLGRVARFPMGAATSVNPIIRKVYLSSMRQVGNFYDTWEKAQQDHNLTRVAPERFTSEQQSKIYGLYKKGQRISDLLSRYRKLDKEDSTTQEYLRTEILDGIDSYYN